MKRKFNFATSIKLTAATQIAIALTSEKFRAVNVLLNNKVFQAGNNCIDYLNHGFSVRKPWPLVGFKRGPAMPFHPQHSHVVFVG